MLRYGTNIKKAVKISVADSNTHFDYVSRIF